MANHFQFAVGDIDAAGNGRELNLVGSRRGYQSRMSLGLVTLDSRSLRC